MKIKILIDLCRFFSNAQRRSLTSELSEDQNHINFPDVIRNPSIFLKFFNEIVQDAKEQHRES